eukprot:560410-Pelagomonas_calceolata.AAC.4
MGKRDEFAWTTKGSTFNLKEDRNTKHARSSCVQKGSVTNAALPSIQATRVTHKGKLAPARQPAAAWLQVPPLLPHSRLGGNIGPSAVKAETHKRGRSSA